MRKFFCLLLTLAALAMIGGAVAEESYLAPTPEELSTVYAQDATAVDLTPVINAAVGLLGEILVAVIAVVVLPPLKAWMQEKMSKTMQDKSLDMIRQLVLAAEQLFVGSGRGEEKFDYVLRGLRERGFSVDVGLIEAAVHSMNMDVVQVFESKLGTVKESPEEPPVVVDECI